MDNDRRRDSRWVVAAGIALVTFLSFLPALKNQFVSWDDPENFLANPHFRGLGWSQLVWMFTKSARLGNYIPVTWLTFGADYLAWGMNPFGYHLSNLLLHALNAAILFQLIFVLFERATPKRTSQGQSALWPAAAVGALFFAVHPLRVESVAWVTERRDILSGTFFLLTILSYLNNAGLSFDNPHRSARYGLTLLIYFIGLLSKPMLMTLPVILTMLDVYPLGRLNPDPRQWAARSSRPIWMEKVPFWFLAIATAALAAFNQMRAGDMATLAKIGVLRRIAIACYGVAFYIWKTVRPIGLVPLHPLFPKPDHFAGIALSSALVMLLVTLYLYRQRHRWPAGLAVWIYYLVTLSPVSGLAQSGDQLVADRYSYLPGLGWSILFGAALLGHQTAGRVAGPRSRWWNVRMAAAILILSGLAALSWRQCAVWHDSKALWGDILHHSPDNYTAINNYGIILQNEGQADAAMQFFLRAIEINPEYALARDNLGLALTRQGKTQEALAEFQKALASNPRDLMAHTSLGVILAGQGRLDQAIDHFHQALDVNPDSVLVNNNLGILLMRQGKVPEAIAHFQTSIEADPRQAVVHYYLAVALAEAGLRDQSVDHLQLANRYRSSGTPEFQIR